jgi:hypothetical protein
VARVGDEPGRARRSRRRSCLIQVSDTTTHSIAVANTFQDVTWSTNGVTEGFVHVPGTPQVLVPGSGVYRINVSLPMKRPGLIATPPTATACLAVNGTSVVCQSAGFGPRRRPAGLAPDDDRLAPAW